MINIVAGAASPNSLKLRPALVIFDLDGTLVDSAPDICTALGLALVEVGLPAPDLAQVRHMVGEGQRVLVERALRHAGGSPGLLDGVLGRFRGHYGEHLMEQTRSYPGVPETLRALPAQLLRAVATNKPGAWARQIVDALGLRDQLGEVVGEDDVGRRKPDPLLLQILCQRAGVTPQEAIMVGDSAIDMQTAAAAGMTMVLCTYGYTDQETLAAARQPPVPGKGDKPTDRSVYVIDRFPALLELIG